MIVTHLRLANVRAIEAAEFRFEPGFNLIVGANGVGKTTVLDVLRVCLSAITKQTNGLRGRAVTFHGDDIRRQAEALTAECGVRLGEGISTYLVHRPRSTSAARREGAGLPREQVFDTPERAEFLGGPPKLSSVDLLHGRPLAVLFSTGRAVPTERAPSKNVAAGGIAAAYADAFAHRELRLGEFAAWMRVQRALEGEVISAGHGLLALQGVVPRFLPGYSDLALGGESQDELWISRGETRLPVRLLSDGERGVLALVLDLTRRLSQANPDFVDPAAEAAAVVLIDEIDLHLHPSWQRKIVSNLQVAFPQCQFIATTHSPQVIGEVTQDRVQIIADGEVYSPSHSYGVDSSRILEEVMDADPRAEAVAGLLAEISQTIGRQDYARAGELLNQLGERLGEDDPEVTRVRTLLDFLEGAG